MEKLLRWNLLLAIFTMNTWVLITLDVNGREVPFNIGNYMEAFKLKYVRLYLLSKKVTSGSKESDDDLYGSP